MRQIWLWLTLIAIVFLGAWFLLTAKQEPTLPPEPKPIESFQPSAPMQKDENLGKISVPETLPKVSNVIHSPRPPGPYKPEGNVIEFKVVDGYAVAYGDLLLGKLSEPVSGNQGRFDAPVPQLWERSEIPYAISKELPHPERVEKALDYLRKKTPVNFVPYTGQKDAILFEVGTQHCLSLLGKVGGIQPIRLASGCRWQEVLHEVLHALGFVHEQSRLDRDQFVSIIWDNIEEKYRDQFAWVPESFQEGTRGFPFDFRSVMLYQPNAFAIRPDLITMKSIRGEAISPVQEGLSEIDIQKINRMFRGYE